MRKIIPIILFACIVCACSSVDCPIENTVYTVYTILNKEEETDTLNDTLTISTRKMDGSDSILINKDVGITTFSLPVSYTQSEDSLIFQIKGDSIILDTVVVKKTNTPHFESVDCSANYFHTITGVSYTHNAIDSIVINNSNVTFNASKEHFHIYFKNND